MFNLHCDFYYFRAIETFPGVFANRHVFLCSFHVFLISSVMSLIVRHTSPSSLQDVIHVWTSVLA